MLLTGLCVALLVVAAATDMARHKIYNWTTYPGMLAALAINAAGSLSGLSEESHRRLDRWIGWIGLADSLAGFLACGFLLLVCFVFFRIGGGDVKLMAMLGAFLGLEQGIETLLWTFVLGGALGVIVLIWRVGLWNLLGRIGRHLLWTLRLGRPSTPTEEERRALQPPLFLAPPALVALLIVRFELLERFIAFWRS